jgi:amino acid transporter
MAARAGAANGVTDGPRRHLGVRHAVSLCVGMVVGAGIFKTSPMVAQSLPGDAALYAAWALGGLLSFVGALCFAEMAAAFPDAGGDYRFLRLAFGARLGFLFAWSRFAVIHTGSMALLAFVFSDYVGQVLPLGPVGSAALAAGVVAVLTLLNLLGVRAGLGTQLGLMGVVLAGLLCLTLSGAALAWQGLPPALPAGSGMPRGTDWGTAMVFVFLAYGGWSDAATLSAELRDGRRGIVRALVTGLGLVTALYLLANWAYLRGLGLEGLARSEAPAAELARRAFGPPGEWLMVAIVATAAVAVMNALLIAGARTTYAAARDWADGVHLGRWDAARGTPRAAVLAMGGVALLLVGLGTLTRGGFATMVDYLSPVYWFFLVLSGLALIVLRRRFPHAERPFRVPLYPLLPLAFSACSAYVLYASLAYVRLGALVGVAVLAAGALLLWPLARAPAATESP